ncbi:MAG TPA: flagellin, partial [Proteiniclasticum sp.]|uniref:flagellin n=1 Tax=Proteiniclasticum sp. TaxID=2053595 RepID=UPI000E7F505F
IKGLNQSVRNAQDGISLIQTAEGALNETHSILNRMRELAVQSSNDTNTNSDRDEIQKEMNQLSQEITRISENTEFNTQKLLTGDFASKKLHIGANEGQAMEVSIADMGSNALGVEGKVGSATAVTGVANLNVRAVNGDTALTIKFAAAGNDAVTETTATRSGDEITVTLKQGAGTPGTIADTHGAIADALSTIEGLIVEKATGFTAGTAIAAAPANTTTSTTLDATYNRDMGINVSTQADADAAITTIDNAITSVSAERSKLGAVQNRLDHTINNLTATSENLSAAESRIRDVDMAKEMMEFTKNNILNQASTAMLAQANQMPQGVLQLLG